jgi:predicted  nucleic acid-binding Zn-ribbon protein
MARKPKKSDSELSRRLSIAHRSLRDISVYAGWLLGEAKRLQKQIDARDLLIEHLKEQVAEAESTAARAMKF